jgi:hypothetical protein
VPTVDDQEPHPGGDPEANDEAITQALRRSLVALVGLGVLAGTAVWWLQRRPEARGVAPAPLASPVQPARKGPQPPRVRFTDITRESGIRFTPVNGARGAKLLPETMGGGVACFDLDGDGDADLLFVSGMEWPDAPDEGRPPATAALYRNDTSAGGPIRFTDITAGSGLDVPFYGMGVAAGDMDGDQRTDLLLTGVGGLRLFRNLGDGRFRDVTTPAGLPASSSGWSTAAAWLDMDRDGDLDLFVGHYVEWSPGMDREVNNQLVGVGRAYGRPWLFPGTFPALYRNDGPASPGAPPRFTEVSARSGLRIRNPATGQPMAKTLAVAPIDLDDDGWMDLVVANDTVQNFVFTNRHDGTFQEVGAQSGLAFDAYGQTRGAMGIDAARFRSDRALGIAIGNFANEMNALYVAQPARDALVFADEAITEGIGPASRLLLKFGLFFFDYDLDGRLDVLTTNGHIEEDIEKVQPNVRYRQPAQLFWNGGGDQTFVGVGPDDAGSDLFQGIVGRGSAHADFDLDGDPDVVMTQVGGPPLVLRNDQALGHGWVRLRLVGNGANPEAIGAWVHVRTEDGRRISRQVMPTKSYLSQSELPLHLGLGRGKILEAKVRWPDGQETPFEAPAQRTTVVRQ